jgi:hypothetical protein
MGVRRLTSWRACAAALSILLSLTLGSAHAESSSRQSSSPQGRSVLRVTLVSTVVVEPARYSVCQIRNDETNSTRVFRVGDDLMGWRIDRIAKDQVWLGKGMKLEYIERSRSASPLAAPVDVNPHDGQYAHGQ